VNKTKKIIIFSIVGLVLLVGIVLGGFYFKKLNKVVSIITMDINPSIAISLNYKNEVVKVEGLNEDGKKLLKEENFKGDDLEDVVEDITEIVIEKGYITEEDNHILINVEGKDIEEKVVTLINKEFKEENVECNVIMQEINEQAKENAEKYGITDSKASYIESVIKENTELTFEELKDKTISEINKYIEKQEEQNKTEESNKEEEKEPVKEEEKEEQNKEDNKPNTNNTTKPNTNNNSGSNNTSTSKPNKKPVSTPPASNDRTGAWCTFLNSIPPEGGVEFETPGQINDFATYAEAAKKYAPQDANFSTYYGSMAEYKTASYCSSGFIEFFNNEKTKEYRIYLDSVTLELLEPVKVTELEKAKIDEAGARPIIAKWLMDTYSVDINDCGWESYYFTIDGSTKKPEWQYICKIEETTTYYAVTVVATDGSTKTGYTWTN